MASTPSTPASHADDRVRVWSEVGRSPNHGVDGRCTY